MNTNEIKESAINLFWTFDKTLSDALDYAITEATAQLQEELEELALQIEKATPFIREIQKENETLRNAQKSCADCDGPTLEQFKKMQAENLELRGKLNRECENHDACRIQVEQLQAEKATPATCEWTCLAEGWHKNPHTQHPVFALNLKATPFCQHCGKPIAQVKGVGL